MLEVPARQALCLTYSPQLHLKVHLQCTGVTSLPNKLRLVAVIDGTHGPL